MNGTVRTDTARVHPIVGVLRDQGRTQTWLARRIGRSHAYTNRVLNGLHPAIPSFRSACALLLGLAESELFHAGDVDHGGAASGAPKRRASRVGSAAGRGVYALAPIDATDDAVGGAVAS